MTYKISAMMFVLWGMLAMVTAIVTLEQDQSDVGGSSAAFQSLANTSANPDNVSINQGTVRINKSGGWCLGICKTGRRLG